MSDLCRMKMNVVVGVLISPVILAAKMMVYLEPSSDNMACEISTALDESLTGRNIQVCGDLPVRVADITHPLHKPLDKQFVRVCCRSAMRCWKLCVTGSWVRASRRLLRLTALPAIRSTPTACPSCLLVTMTTTPRSVPTATCRQESMTIWQTKCEL